VFLSKPAALGRKTVSDVSHQSFKDFIRFGKSQGRNFTGVSSSTVASRAVCHFLLSGYISVGFNVLTTLVNGRFGGTCRLHLQGRRISQARNQHESDSKQ
jgi:hypothetical protein